MNDLNDIWNYKKVSGQFWQSKSLDEQLILLNKHYPIGSYFDFIDIFDIDGNWKHDILFELIDYELYDKQYIKYTQDKIFYTCKIKKISGELRTDVFLEDYNGYYIIHPGYLKLNIEYSRDKKINNLLNGK